MQTQQKHSGRIVLSIVGVCLVGIAIPSTFAQTTVTNSPVADSQIFPTAFTNTNRGIQPEMYLGDVGVGSPGSRVLLRFALTNIPAGATITSATLKLTILNGSPGQMPADGYRVLSSWIEGDGFSGFDSGTSGVTWDRRDKAGSLPNWVAGGASGSGTDRAVSPSFTLTSSDVSGGIVSKDVTSDAQSWLSSPSSNFGWLLQVQTYNPGEWVGYRTREQSGGPQLIVTYVPEPTSALLLLVGGLGLIRRRRAE